MTAPWLEAVAVRHVYRRREALAGVSLASGVGRG